VLQNTSVEIAPGGVTAFVGPSGSGKSTILQLLLRFYEPDSGKILLDGRELSDLDLNWHRQNIGFLPQESHLFSMSIRANVLLGLSASCAAGLSAFELDRLVQDACSKAHAHEFIMRLPDGYHTNVGERGSLLSGGQRQRIALARAIISDPPILVFDEPTSALDAESEAIVQAALDHVCIGKTTITVAHRLSTIRHASNIVVMKQGRIVEQGDHDQLLARNGEYAGLVAAQRLETSLQDDQPLESPTDVFKYRASMYSDSGLSSTTVGSSFGPWKRVICSPSRCL
jgi:ATP-binding cassette, subfamily B (MDR/TAP), member 1